MLITRKSMLTGKSHTKDLPITQEQIDMYYNGMLLQDAFRNLSPADREFFKTGITDEEWENAFGGTEE